MVQGIKGVVIIITIGLFDQLGVHSRLHLTSNLESSRGLVGSLLHFGIGLHVALSAKGICRAR